MLAPKAQYDLHNAKAYFEEHLAVGDYYSEGQMVAGEWIGKGAQSLQLSGNVRMDDFVALCDNHDPRTGQRLTARHKSTRRVIEQDGTSSEVANRRVFYDFTFSPPKSVSIVALVAGDERIVKAHDEAVRVAMQELEQFAATRVRQAGQMTDRTTSNVVAALFRHDTSRALDPHLHTHGIVFNATYDETERRWKALQNHDMLAARKYVENVYYHEIARRLRGFGYCIKNAARGDFEIEGVPQQLIATFGKRHRQIDEQTRELLKKSPELARGNLADVREVLAQKNRAWKDKEVTIDRLREWWETQLTTDDQTALAGLQRGHSPVENQNPRIIDVSLRWAQDHLFDRKSVVHEQELWRYALERSRGEAFLVEQLHEATAQAGYVVHSDNPRRLTTKAVLQREWELICLAKDGKGTRRPLFDDWNGGGELDEAQRMAARHLLRSRDFVSLFRGGAGTGKSFTLRTVFDALKEINCPVRVIAPQRQQVKDLVQDGLTGAQTVSEFLTRRDVAKGSVVIVDEAGQIGARQMLDLLDFVQDRGGRIILSGDTRQHGAVQASDALWAIEKYAGLRMAELNAIRRQDPARGKTDEEKHRIGEYKQAVEAASIGDITSSFSQLEKMGAVVECTLGDQQEKLANEYVAMAKAGQSTLVVSPTWDEINRVNERVRERLQAEGLISRRERKVDALQTVDLTDAQKLDQRYYPENALLVFNQKLKGISQGQKAFLVAITKRGVIVESDGRIHTVGLKFLNHFTVCRSQPLSLSKGDRLQLKSNSQTADGKRVANGELVTVQHIEKNGDIRLQDGRVLGTEYRQFVRGYAVTSYASQGKTVDHVLFSDSSIKVATNDQQWYVTISRGRKGIKIFTADKERLRENVTRSGKRELAMDIAKSHLSNVIKSRRTLIHGYRTLRAWGMEMGRRFTAHKHLRARTQAAQQINLHQTP